MTTTAIRKKLVDYLKIADDKKIQAIYTMVEDDINTDKNDWNKDFLSEMEKRSKEFKRGKVKTYSWQEAKRAAIKKVKSKKD